MAKKAMLVNIDLLVRVIIDDFVDPDVDPEFDETVTNAVKARLADEGVSFIGEGINDYRDDEETPYDPEFD
jgi:hypothetical protein